MIRYGTALAALSLAGSLAGCSSGSGLPAVSGPTTPRLELVATEMRYTPAQIAVPAGDVPVILRNEGTVLHDLRIEDEPTFLLEAGAGKTVTATWSLDEGRYKIYCSLPGHRSAGMEGILEAR